MSSSIPQRKWLPLADAVTRISERLGISPEFSERALRDVLKDEITRARGSFLDEHNDRIYLSDISLQMLLNSHIEWNSNRIVFNEPMPCASGHDGTFPVANDVEVYRPDLDEWLKAQPMGKPSASDHKGADVVSEEAGAKKPTPVNRRKGGPKPGPYLGYLHTVLDGVLKREGASYFTSEDKRFGSIEDEVRRCFRRDDPEDRLRLPKSRSGLQDQIRKWMRTNELLD